VKTAVSVPDELFEAGERLAARLGWGRSQLYARALEAFLAQSAEDEVTTRLDEVHGSEVDPAADPEGIGVRAGRALIDRGAWEW
jgi:hypothetical protein